jgi:cytochrome b
MSARLKDEETVVVWDWPARITHWGFSASLCTALVVGFWCDPEGPWFRWHIFAAYFAVWFLGVRILLGFLGSRYLLWSRLFQSSRNLRGYFASVFLWKREPGVGLNPASALFAVAIYGCLVALIYSGFVADLVETWHGWLAYVAVGLIAVHLGGLSLHALRHRALTPLAMVHGRVVGRYPEGLASTNARAGVALFVLSVCALWVLLGCYDEPNAVIAIPGLPEIPVPTIQKG